MTDPVEPAKVYLGLGANLGNRLTAMRAAVGALGDHPLISVDLRSGVASLLETSPVGGPADQQPYLNSAVRIETTLSPIELLRVVLAIEADLGRTRRVRWEARVIDIDLLLYDNLVVDTLELTIPHPHLHLRRFVLDPLSEIAGEVVHPRLGRSIEALAHLLRDSDDQPAVATVAGRQWLVEAGILPSPQRNGVACR